MIAMIITVGAADKDMWGTFLLHETNFVKCSGVRSCRIGISLFPLYRRHPPSDEHFRDPEGPPEIPRSLIPPPQFEPLRPLCNLLFKLSSPLL
jgi:hypothetical protein